MIVEKTPMDCDKPHLASSSRVSHAIDSQAAYRSHSVMQNALGAAASAATWRASTRNRHDRFLFEIVITILVSRFACTNPRSPQIRAIKTSSKTKV